mgnify:CR=1 FL=1
MKAHTTGYAYLRGLRMGRFMRDEAPEDMPANPYPYGTIEAMEWDRGYNHGRFDQTQQDDGKD